MFCPNMPHLLARIVGRLLSNPVNKYEMKDIVTL